MIHEGKSYGLSRDRVTLYDTTVLTLSLDQLRKVSNGSATLEPPWYACTADSLVLPVAVAET